MSENSQQEPWWKWPLVIAVIVVPVLVVLGNWAYTTDREQKIEAHLNNAKEVRNLLCDDQGTELRAEFQEKWEQSYKKLGFGDAVVVSPLRLEEVDSYYDEQCVLAKEYLQTAKDAVTDDEKIASFKRVRQLRNEVLAHVDSLLTDQLDSADECAKAYQAVELKEKEFNRVDPLGDKTRSYIAQGNWHFCRFYADNAVVAVEQFAACQGNLVLAQSLENSLVIQHQYANEARTYAVQRNWLFCAFYAKEAVDAMLPLMPTPPP